MRGRARPRRYNSLHRRTFGSRRAASPRHQLAFCLPRHRVTMASAPLTIISVSRSAFVGGRRFSNNELLWMGFVIVQALDGAMSYVGVSMHGPVIEGNPLVSWYLTALGPA